MNYPRGYRLNNPLNIERTSTVWVGMSSAQPDERFVAFETPEYGIRAAARILQTYQEKYGIGSIRQVIERWAPSTENDTSAYIKAVEIWSDFDADDTLNLSDYNTVSRLMKAMARMELGKPAEGMPDAWYKEEVWEKGLRLAGLIPSKPLTKSRTIAGNSTAAVAGTAAVLTILTDIGIPPEIIALLPTALSGLGEQATAAILLAIAAAGNIFSAWARADDKAKGRL